MDARDFLTVADRFRGSPQEAEVRTSIGRSYYALFNVLLGTLSARGVVFHESADDHRHLVSYLAKAGNREAGALGLALNDLRTQRNTADYKMNVAVTAKTGEFVYGKAKRMIEKFDAIPPAELDEVVRRIRAIP